MTPENGYEERAKHDESVELLKDIRRTLKSVDGKVEDILDDLREHFEDVRDRSGDWSVHGLYDGAEHYR